MAKLTCVYRSDDMSGVKFGKRQLPLAGASGDLMMLMDLNTKGLVFDHPYVKGKDLEEFTRKYNILSSEERKISLEVSRTDFISVLSQSVPCVGCRRSVERLFHQLMHSGHPTLDPVVIKNDGVLTVLEEKMDSPQAICTLLHKHNILLNSLLENQPRNKKSSRCTLHSLDSFRSRPFSDMWRDVWNCMKQQCKDEIAHIDAEELHNTLDVYLKKHKFCQECRTKVEKAYALLVNESNPAKEKGYVAALYSNIKKCIADKHIHLQTKADFIDSLIKRAEPELNGRHRERHAKTLEIAQEEVLTCIGMFIYERLRRVHMCLKEEENACQVLAAVAVHALCRSFDMAVEKKRGITNLELLYKEISRAEKAKEQRKEQKKLKKKKKKNDKKFAENQMACIHCMDDDEAAVCTCAIDENGYDTEEQEAIMDCCSVSDIMELPLVGKGGTLKSNAAGGGGGGTCCANSLSDEISIDVKDEISLFSCHSCEANVGSGSGNGNNGGGGVIASGGIGNGCSKSIDGGYVSEPSSSNHDGPCSALSSSRTSSITSSPEGSEVACSDGFCNHHDQHSRSTPEYIARHVPVAESVLTLQQMLEDSPSEDEKEIGTIPDEVLADFKCRQPKIQALREELRQDLRKKFNQMCVKTRMAQKVCPH